MTFTLLKSSKTKDKMYRKYIGKKQKDTISFKHYILYTNKFNTIKKIFKKNEIKRKEYVNKKRKPARH